MARTRVRYMKNLRAVGDRPLEWIKVFGAFVQFSGGEGSFIEYIIAYVLTAAVSLNMETGLFTLVAARTTSTTSDHALLALLENPQKLICDLLVQVQVVTAPKKPTLAIPKLSLKSLHSLYVSYNHLE